MTHSQVGIVRVGASDLAAVENRAWEALANRAARDSVADYAKDPKGGFVQAVTTGWSAENILLEFPTAALVPDVASFMTRDLLESSAVRTTLVAMGMEDPFLSNGLPPHLSSTKGILVIRQDRIGEMQKLIERIASDAWSLGSDEVEATKMITSTLADAKAVGTDVCILWKRRGETKFELSGGGCRTESIRKAVAAGDIGYFRDLRAGAVKQRLMAEVLPPEHACAAKALLTFVTGSERSFFSEPTEILAFLHLLRKAGIWTNPPVRAFPNHFLARLDGNKGEALLGVAKSSRAGRIEDQELEELAGLLGTPPPDIAQFCAGARAALTGPTSGELISFLKAKRTSSKATVVCICL